MNLPLSAIAVVFVGAWGFEGCRVKMDVILMLSLSILSRVQQESFISFSPKIASLLVGTYSRLHFGQRGFPLHLILFRRIYIYGGMTPSFDFVVVIGNLLLEP